MSIERKPWNPEIPTGVGIDYRVLTYPNQVEYRDPLIGFELKGALGTMVKRVVTARHPHQDKVEYRGLGDARAGEAWNVRTTFQLPHRDDCSRIVDIMSERVEYPLQEHLDRGLTPEQSCVCQAIKWMWDHELSEGIFIRGIGPLSDPENEH